MRPSITFILKLEKEITTKETQPTGLLNIIAENFNRILAN